jgi:hypothetical protein
MINTHLSGGLLSHPRGALPRSPRKVIIGNAGNAANLILFRRETLDAVPPVTRVSATEVSEWYATTSWPNATVR